MGNRLATTEVQEQRDAHFEQLCGSLNCAPTDVCKKAFELGTSFSILGWRAVCCSEDCGLLLCSSLAVAPCVEAKIQALPDRESYTLSSFLLDESVIAAVERYAKRRRAAAPAAGSSNSQDGAGAAAGGAVAGAGEKLEDDGAGSAEEFEQDGAFIEILRDALAEGAGLRCERCIRARVFAALVQAGSAAAAAPPARPELSRGGKSDKRRRLETGDARASGDEISAFAARPVPPTASFECKLCEQRHDVREYNFCGTLDVCTWLARLIKLSPDPAPGPDSWDPMKPDEKLKEGISQLFCPKRDPNLEPAPQKPAEPLPVPHGAAAAQEDDKRKLHTGKAEDEEEDEEEGEGEGDEGEGEGEGEGEKEEEGEGEGEDEEGKDEEDEEEKGKDDGDDGVDAIAQTIGFEDEKRLLLAELTGDRIVSFLTKAYPNLISKTGSKKCKGKQAEGPERIKSSCPEAVAQILDQLEDRLQEGGEQVDLVGADVNGAVLKKVRQHLACAEGARARDLFLLAAAMFNRFINTRGGRTFSRLKGLRGSGSWTAHWPKVEKALTSEFGETLQSGHFRIDQRTFRSLIRIADLVREYPAFLRATGTFSASQLLFFLDVVARADQKQFKDLQQRSNLSFE
eukprot:tig00020801_g13937.t1